MVRGVKMKITVDLSQLLDIKEILEERQILLVRSIVGRARKDTEIQRRTMLANECRGQYALLGRLNLILENLNASLREFNLEYDGDEEEL